MAPLSIQIYVVGPVQTNCYFAINDDTKEVLIIDPGASAKQLAEKVKEQGLKPVAILLTHGHFDHILAAEAIRDRYQIPIYACQKEEKTLQDPNKNICAGKRKRDTGKSAAESERMAGKRACVLCR